MIPRRRLRNLCILGGLVTAVLVVCVRIELFQGSQRSPLVRTMPPDPEFDEQGDVCHDRRFVAEYAWRAFVALNWPADPNRRGEPHPTKKFGDEPGPVVWGNWKSTGELFPHEPERSPPEWDDAGVSISNLTSVARLAKVAQAGLNADEPGIPVIAQNNTYLRYEVRVNRIEYDFIRSNQFYLRDKLPSANTPSPFPALSVHVKAAWMELTDGRSRERFYCVPAKLVEWHSGASPTTRDALVALVGLHIVCKTQNRPAWIWTTFEHVDNTEPGPGATRASFSKNDSSVVHDETRGTDWLPPEHTYGTPLPAPVKPVDIKRLQENAIHADIEAVNRRYREHPEIRNTVWRHYQLVAVQWPPKKSGNPDNGPPRAVGRLPAGNVANATLETYTQGSSCITCHQPADHLQFVFYPQLLARPLTPPNNVP